MRVPCDLLCNFRASQSWRHAISLQSHPHRLPPTRAPTHSLLRQCVPPAVWGAGPLPGPDAYSYRTPPPRPHGFQWIRGAPQLRFHMMVLLRSRRAIFVYLPFVLFRRFCSVLLPCFYFRSLAVFLALCRVSCSLVVSSRLCPIHVTQSHDDSKLVRQKLSSRSEERMHSGIRAGKSMYGDSCYSYWMNVLLR
jgi:hypothetical protein